MSSTLFNDFCVASNSVARVEHAQRFNWAFLFAQNSSIQSKNTVLHFPKSRCITVSRVCVVAARDSPVARTVRVVVWRGRDKTVFVVAVRDEIEFSRGVVATRDFSVFVFRDVIVFVVVRGKTPVLDLVDCVRAPVVVVGVVWRVVRVWIVFATAPSNAGITKHAAKIRFRPFISF